MSRFTPKRSIGPACEQAVAAHRFHRIQRIYVRHIDRLAEPRHERLDNALYAEGRRLFNLTNQTTEA